MTYYSRKMSSAEWNYDIGDKKLLAIITVLEEWYIYIEGAVETIIYINYKNLLSFATIKELNRRQVRWLELLGWYRFIIKQVAGRDNRWINTLSR